MVKVGYFELDISCIRFSILIHGPISDCEDHVLESQLFELQDAMDTVKSFSLAFVFIIILEFLVIPLLVVKSQELFENEIVLLFFLLDDFFLNLFDAKLCLTKSLELLDGTQNVLGKGLVLLLIVVGSLAKA